MKGCDRRTSTLKLLPLILPVGGLFAVGLVMTVLQSFGMLVPVPDLVPGGRAWMNLFTDRWMWATICHTLAVSIVSAVVSVALGIVLAWGIYRLPGAWRKLAGVYKISLILPHLLAAYLVVLIFGQSGFLSALAARLGIIQAPGDFPNVLYGGHGIGVGLAYVMKETSFVILMAMGLLRKLDENLLISARMLGASRTSVFLDIAIPHLRPVIVSCFVILSLYAMGSFEIPRLIGGSRPQMLSISVYNLYFHRDLSHRPEAAALLTMLILLSSLLIYGFFLRGKRGGYQDSAARR